MLAAIARGDQARFVAFYREHAPLVARVGGRLGLNAADVEDLVQTTFVEVLDAAARFEGRSSLRSWVIGIALNQARNVIRSRVRARNHAPGLRAAEPSSADSAESLLSHAEQMDRMRHAIQGLPDIQREALALCELQELPAREVAALLGVPAGTVWRRLHDARASLRRRLDEKEPP